MRSQINGNKAVHRGQRGSWQHRCYAVVLRYNNGIGWVGDFLNDFYQIDIGRKSTEYFRSVCDIFQTSNGGIIPLIWFADVFGVVARQFCVYTVPYGAKSTKLPIIQKIKYKFNPILKIWIFPWFFPVAVRKLTLQFMMIYYCFIPYYNHCYSLSSSSVQELLDKHRRRNSKTGMFGYSKT